jgi:hypothetical protein
MKPLFRSKCSYNNRIIASAPQVYFPLDEISGSVAKNWGSLGAAVNGAYVGVDLRNTPGPKGSQCPYFDGVNDYVNVYFAALAAAFNLALGSFMLWAKMAGSAWTDGSYHFMPHLGHDGNQNYIRIIKSNSNNTMSWSIVAGGAGRTVTGSGNTDTGFFNVLLTWDVAADQAIVYKNGLIVGNTLTSLGTWSGALVSNLCTVGAQTTNPSFPFLGYLAHFACGIGCSRLMRSALCVSEVIMEWQGYFYLENLGLNALAETDAGLSPAVLGPA